MLMAMGHEETLKNELLREILLCSPLLFRQSLANNQRMLIGKVMEQNSPWDVVIHEETQLRAVHGTNKPLPDPFFIQLKELFSYGVTQTIVLDDWLMQVKETIGKAKEKYKGRDPEGILYIYNRLPLESTPLKKLEEELALIKIDEPIPFKQVTITVDAGVTGVLSWQLYPSFHAIGSVQQKDILKLKDLYGFD